MDSVRLTVPLSSCLSVLQGHTGPVSYVRIQDDVLVSGSADGSICVWSLEQLVAIYKLTAHNRPITSNHFENPMALSGGKDGLAKVWDVTTGDLVKVLGQPARAVWAVTLANEKAIIAVAREDRVMLEVNFPY